MKKIVLFTVFVLLLALLGNLLVGNLLPRWTVLKLAGIPMPDWVDVQLIGVDGGSRRGVPLEGVRDIVIHYVGNPGTTAQQNRDYFNSAASEVSAHFVIGLEGEIIQCIPLTEKSSASNDRNRDTISIEVCHPDETGKFTDQSYAALVKLTAWLCGICSLDSSHVIRHYDITQKQCPLYFVTDKDAWQQFRQDVQAAVSGS
ncbi:MAG: peptidoglycan recognition family protein [Eubacteriales bacterium]|nr:peptidoglycan recognition family protein [Eubacteriales bacterium]